MASTRQYFYNVDDSSSPVTIEVSIFGQPGVISVHLEQTKIGNTETNHFPKTYIGVNNSLKSKTLMIVTEIFDIDPEGDDAKVDVKLTGGLIDRIINEPVIIPTDKSILLVFFITFRKIN
ncbi:hypothetical protein VB796_16455 [Arcicella sp. LKC2W]|uniref:hypothetical protein n=1 Tax=Arcicella sp. LKC2W TaxID=2984198 RepID=UPI002B200FEE|nr:hypothetical protein [Arcicella sp. LKC2W]MEA5460650.1 hypothetical protein [Arcicella sp. LKC2W]